MIAARAFAGKHYAVYGLARSGRATVAALLASGARVTAWDEKEEARASLLHPSLSGEGPGVGAVKPDTINPTPTPPLKGSGLEVAPLDDLARFDSLVLSPGVPLNRHPIARRAREAGVEIIGDIELFARARPELPPHKVVGITGTNGKSTTTALIHHILRTAGVPTTMGGNIGLPILAQDPLPPNENGVGVYVLELSSYQIDLTRSLDCDVAVLLNITPDHLDRYDGSFEAYAASKARLFDMQSASHAPVIVGEDEESKKIRHSRASGNPAKEPNVASRLRGNDEQGSWPALQGPHNHQNARAAIATCRALGIADDAIAEGLRTYPGLPHRMERVAEKAGVLFVNDSKATNPTATAPALAAFPKIRWILGGLPKGDDLDECAPHFGHVRSAYTIGKAGELFARLLAPHMPVKNCGELARAVNEAAADAEPGDTVLLSPACASFDQFRDFEARGEEFRKLVGGL